MTLEQTVPAQAQSRFLYGLLHQLNRNGPLDPVFAKRRAQVIAFGCMAMFVPSLPWALFFVRQQGFAAAAVEVAMMLGALLIYALLRARLDRLAALSLCVLCPLGIAALAVLTDPPSLSHARNVQLLLLPTMPATYLLLRHEARAWRRCCGAFQLIAFVVLTVSRDPLGVAPLLPPQAQLPAGYLVALLSTVSFAWVTFILQRDLRTQSAQQIDFARGIGAGEIHAFLQPQCDAQGRVTGAEALMRWLHPERGWVSPADFIPMAESSGLVGPASEQLARTVCEALQRWQGQAGLEDLSVAINVSAVQFLDPPSMDRLLALAAQVPRGRLKFELTESLFVADMKTIQARMAQCRALGVPISLDDFGTGYSSLAYLRQLPLDQLKVDQSFVRELPQSSDAIAIARSVIRLGQDLGLEMIAEGVETREQMECLLGMGCERFQGYLFSRPVPIETFEAFVQSSLRKG